MSLPPPPSVDGLPIVGNAVEYFTRPMELFRRGYEQHGPAFSIRIGPKRAAVLLGPEANRLVFKQTDKALSISETFRWLVPLFGDKFPLAATPPVHHAYRPELLRPLKEREVDRYCGALAVEARSWVEDLDDAGTLELVDALGRVILSCAARVFLGAEVRERLGDRFPELFKAYTRRASNHILRSHWLAPSARRRRHARQELFAAVTDVVAERTRARDAAHDDYLQALIDLEPPDGAALSDDDVFGLALGMVWGGYPTAWGHTTWTLIQLLQHPEYLATVRAQIDEVFSEASTGDEMLDGPALRGLDRLDWAMLETERMRSVVLVLGRKTVEPYDVNGYRVPAGWLTLASPAFTHRLPDLYPDPDRYDPERFSPRRARDNDPRKLVGFGGGSHSCIGKEYAQAETKMLIATLLRRYDVELLDAHPRNRRGPNATRPQPPVRIAYRRRRETGSSNDGR